jgi:histidine phosphotransferase ChpT
MSSTSELKLLEMVSARMCHDLISPVSAIGNGVELVTEFEDSMQGEALALIGDSARVASRLLQFFRAAVGSARGADGSPLGLSEARQRTLECFGGGRIRIFWPENPDLGGRAVSRLGLKLLLNMNLTAVDMLPGSGEIELAFFPATDALQAKISARKDAFTLGDPFRRALDGTATLDELTPRTVIAFLCRRLAQEEGMALSLETVPNGAVLIAGLKWA